MEATNNSSQLFCKPKLRLIDINAPIDGVAVLFLKSFVFNALLFTTLKEMEGRFVLTVEHRSCVQFI
jgi:hypothetical protein